jgi:hypothetical protein
VEEGVVEGEEITNTTTTLSSHAVSAVVWDADATVVADAVLAVLGIWDRKNRCSKQVIIGSYLRPDLDGNGAFTAFTIALTFPLLLILPIPPLLPRSHQHR